MSVVYFLVLVGVLIAVHELGHFVAAKLLDVKVLRFSIGFGPAIVRGRLGETEFQLGLVPLGGYVRLLGEDPGEVPEGEPAAADRGRGFGDKPLWRRASIVLAGPAANLVLPILIYFSLFARHEEVAAPIVGDVLAGGPAAQAGLRPGDRVRAAGRRPLRTWEDLEAATDAHAGRELELEVVAEAEGAAPRTLRVTPTPATVRRRTGERRERGLIGITQGPIPAAIGVIDPRSAAGRAGLVTNDVIVAIDGGPIQSWAEASRALGGRARRMPVTVLRPQASLLATVGVRPYAPLLVDLVPDVSGSGHGIQPAELFVREVEPGSPAARAGLERQDLLTHLDGRPIEHWVHLDQALQAAGTREVHLTWVRGGPTGPMRRDATIVQEVREVTDEFGHPTRELVFGASGDFRVGPGKLVRTPSRIGYAASHAFARTGQTIAAMARGLRSIVLGPSPGGGVGGPLAVYRIASVSAAKGWDSYLVMVALISINLGLLNLLPIPGLDGGQLLLIGVEAVRRGPLPARVREAALGFGLILIVLLTVLALKNDVMRYVFP